MKELSIEEKAKRYDEAIERAKSVLNNGKDIDVEAGTTTCEYIFPELKESEDELTWLTKYIEEEAYSLSIDIRDNEDRIKLEKLKKSLAWLKKQGEHANFRNKIQVGDKVTRNEDGVLVNLSQLNRVAKKDEKQGEQKPTTDKVEPKFKVGDWIVDNCGYVWKIKEIMNQFYLLEGVEKDESRPAVEWVDNTFHLWTIQDAKDGDVLAFYYDYRSYKMIQVGIIEKYVGKHGGCSNTFKIYVGLNWENNLQIGQYMGCSDIRPATKEQRDTLMKEMANDEYTFDFEKKELKKIEHKPAWSEEDEKKLQLLIAMCDETKGDSVIYSAIYREMEELKTWLKSLKDR